MIIRICVGSACHTRGAKAVLERLKFLTAHFPEGEGITLQSSFCLGRCVEGVSVQVDDGPVRSVTPESVDTFFFHLLPGGEIHEIHHL